MEMRKVRVSPDDLSQFQSSASNAAEPPSILERCRRSTIRRETQRSIITTYRPSPPPQVKIIIFITALVAILLISVLPAPGWFAVNQRNCTVNVNLWRIHIRGNMCTQRIKALSFSDYIWISRVFILVVAIQNVLTPIALYWYCVRMHIITVLEDAMDAVCCSALFLLSSLVELFVAEGQRFSRVAGSLVYGFAFHTFVVATGVAVFAAVFFRLSIDWEDYYEHAYE